MTKSNLPGQPTLVVSAATGETSIWLSWTPAEADAVGAPTGYMIRWRVRGTPTWTNLDPGAGMMTHLHTGRQSGTTYHYQVAATNSAGTGPWSDEESDTTMSMAKPATPTGVMVVDAGSVVETPPGHRWQR